MRRRQKNAEPFYVRLRASIEAIDLPQWEIAELLEISPSTLEGWLAPPSKSWHREPHRLMQIGAIRVLLGSRVMREEFKKNPGRRQSARERALARALGESGRARTWLITLADGSEEQVKNLAKWCRENGHQRGYQYLSAQKKYNGISARPIGDSV